MRSALRTARYWLPIVAASICLLVAGWVSPALSLLLVIAAFGLVLEAGTAWFAKAGGTGGLQDHKQ